MFKLRKGDRVLLQNKERNTYEIGTINSSHKIKGKRSFKVLTERGTTLEKISIKGENPESFDILDTWFCIVKKL